MNTILMIDDDVTYMKVIHDFLVQQGYETFCAKDVEEAETYLKRTIDCILLDIKLSETKDGFALCKKIKQNQMIPIIFLTNYFEEEDRLQGFRAGADDFVAKPCNLKELQMRIEKRIHPTIRSLSKQTIVSKGLLLNGLEHKAYYQGKWVPLTDAEFDIVYFLAMHESEVFSHYELFDQIWKEPVCHNAHTVQVHISSARKKLNQAVQTHEYIQTIWGKGYRFIGAQNDED